MLTTYRIKSYIAPELEQQLVNYNLDEAVINFFFNSKKLFESLNHVATLTIPIELKSIFNSNSKLRMYCELIESDSQSNVLFGRILNALDCANNDNYLNTLIPGHESSILCKKAILNCLKDKRFPFLVDTYSYDVIKNLCASCSISTQNCSSGVLMSVCPVPSDTVLNCLTEVINNNISQWHIDIDEISEIDLKLLSYLIGLLHGIKQTYLLQIQHIKVHPDFLKDIKNNPTTEYINIAFSMFRAVAFPNLSSRDRHQFSIDFHPNNPFKLCGYDLYRVDVMPPNRSGVSASGCERLLFTIKDGVHYYICYTSNHDFVTSTIKNRLVEI